jgi:TrmH family RNA methyltransferase
MAVLRSRDNARVKRWAKLSRDTRFRRKERRALIEGPHLVSALLERGWKPLCVLVSEAAAHDSEIRRLLEKAKMEPVELSGSVFNSTVDTETPQGIAAEIEIPENRKAGEGSCIFLEGIQDAGNVGAIIRSAAAFGAGEVILDSACADPWSPKALRAGMGGHFALAIRNVATLDKELQTFSGRLLCTVARDGVSLDKADLSGRLGWVLGSEGKGVSAQALKEADQKITIPVAAGTESLNVAAAAAICLYATFSKPGGGSAARGGS